MNERSQAANKILRLAALAISLVTPLCLHAQITNPDKLVAPAPRPPQTRERPKADDMQWLWQYAQPAPLGHKPDLLQDPRFTRLLQAQLIAPQAFWGTGIPLGDAARTFLDGNGVVTETDNRYFTVNGCVADHCNQRGLLFADLGQPNPLVVFAALRWNEQSKIPGQPDAPFTLWLFPARELDPHQLPLALKEALAAWAEADGCAPLQISSTIVVDPTGVPHVIGSLEAGVQPAICTKGTHS